jgi:hypothetical protein
MRRALPALMLLLAACTDEGVNPIVGAAFEELNPLRSGVETPPAPAQPVTRAAIDRADVATIRIRLIEEENGAFMFAASDNGGYVTYASSLRQSLTLPAEFLEISGEVCFWISLVLASEISHTLTCLSPFIFHFSSFFT